MGKIALFFALVFLIGEAFAEKLNFIPKNPEFSYQTTAEMFRMGMISDTSPFRIWYASERVGGRHQIRSNYLYRKYLDGGLPISGVSYYVGDPFKWAAPRLSIQISNTKSKIVEFVGVDFDIKKSTPDLKAVPVFKAFSKKNFLTIENFGWGEMKGVSVKYGVVDPARCEAEKDDGPPIELAERKFDAVSDIVNIDLSREIPSDLSELMVVCVTGILSYEEMSGEKRKIPFSTGVNTVNPGPRAPSSPTEEYLLDLEAGKVGRKSVAIAQHVKPNDVDHFFVRAVSDKSASYEISTFLRDTEGSVIRVGDFDLSLFVPRGREGRLAYGAYTLISRDLYMREAIRDYVLQVSRNPKDSRKLAISVTKKYLLASGDQQKMIINDLRDAFKLLKEPYLQYCILRDFVCVENGEMSWAR